MHIRLAYVYFDNQHCAPSRSSTATTWRRLMSEPTSATSATSRLLHHRLWHRWHPSAKHRCDKHTLTGTFAITSWHIRSRFDDHHIKRGVKLRLVWRNTCDIQSPWKGLPQNNIGTPLRLEERSSHLQETTSMTIMITSMEDDIKGKETSKKRTTLTTLLRYLLSFLTSLSQSFPSLRQYF